MPARSSSSRVSFSLCLSGSSSPSCSAMSPVSVQEDGESSSDSEYPGSSTGCPRSDVAWRLCSDWRSRADRVRRGMLEGRRLGLGDGILNETGLLSSAPIRSCNCALMGFKRQKPRIEFCWRPREGHRSGGQHAGAKLSGSGGRGRRV